MEPAQLTPTDQRDILYRVMLCSAIKAGEKEVGREGRHDTHICGYGAGLPKQLLRMLRPGFPGSGWVSACRWKAVNKYHFMLCFHMQLLLF